MKGIITHEESQTVMKAFLRKGKDMYSNDLLPCSGGLPERHIQEDVFKIMNPLNFYFNAQNGDFIETKKGWKFAGMHPECTFLTSARNKYYAPKYDKRFPTQHEDRKKAIDHFMKCVEILERIGCGYLENPIGIMSSIYRKPDQIIQPYWFGDPERKSTCLWLFGLPKLKPTNMVEPEIIYHKSGRTDSKLHFETMKLPKEERRKARSKTFEGIAEAMAEQWAGFF